MWPNAKTICRQDIYRKLNQVNSAITLLPIILKMFTNKCVLPNAKCVFIIEQKKAREGEKYQWIITLKHFCRLIQVTFLITREVDDKVYEIEAARLEYIEASKISTIISLWIIALAVFQFSRRRRALFNLKLSSVQEHYHKISNYESRKTERCNNIYSFSRIIE